MLVTLPFVLLLLDVWPARRIAFSQLARFDSSARALWKEKLPLFALSAASAAMTFYAQHTSGATQSLTQIPLLPRMSNAVLGYLRYLVKTFWPRNVAIYYPYDSGVPTWLPVAVVLVLAALTWCFVRMRASRPYMLVGWLWYLGTLVPVIGLVQVGSQAYADRYTYVPTIGIGILIVFGVSALVARSSTLARAAAILATFGLAMLLVRTRELVPLWRNTRALFGHALAVTRDNGLAHQVYGNALLSDGEVDAAIEHLNEALRLVPDFPDAHNNLGSALGVKGRYEEAIEHFRAALRTQPTVEVHHNLGFALAELKRFDEAIEEYKAALAIEPDHVGAHSKLGLAYGAKGRLDDAAAELRRALEIAPNEIESRRYYAMTLRLQERREEAIAQFEELLKRKPDDASAAHDLIETQRELAVALTLAGRVEDAIRWYRAILARAPDDLDALNNIAWIRAAHADSAHRNAAEAVTLAERARDKSPQPIAVLYSTLAAAYGEAGRFDDAVKACERAIELARAANQTAEAERYATQLESYRAKRPFRAH
jgi:tetratricopeptide (TPR) repeat protein